MEDAHLSASFPFCNFWRSRYPKRPVSGLYLGPTDLRCMKVHLLQSVISRCITDHLHLQNTRWYLPHEIVHQFNTHWSPPQPSTLANIYDQCLTSTISQRWWKREQYRPKEIMLQLIAADPELATIAWKDLANTSASLDGRLSRFDYYCTDLLQLHRQQHFRSVETYHHQDATMLSLYLAGLQPNQYALYPGLTAFAGFCKAIGSPDIPKVDDLVRYMKVASIVNTYLQRDVRYVQLIEARSASTPKEILIPFQLAYEVILYAGMDFKPSEI